MYSESNVEVFTKAGPVRHLFLFQRRSKYRFHQVSSQFEILFGYINSGNIRKFSFPSLSDCKCIPELFGSDLILNVSPNW